jgi:hypothetical protein
MRTDLEFDDENNPRGNHHHVGPLTHARDRKFKRDPAIEALELAPYQIDFAEPSVALRRSQREWIPLGKMPQNRFGGLIDNIRDRTRIKRTRHRDLSYRSRRIQWLATCRQRTSISQKWPRY